MESRDWIGVKWRDVQTGPSSDRLSKAHTPVVPSVAHSWRVRETQTGLDNVAWEFLIYFHCNSLPLLLSLILSNDLVPLKIVPAYCITESDGSVCCLMPTIKGTRPNSLSSLMACFKVSPLRENFSSVGRNLILTRVIRPAFSTEEWACKIKRATGFHFITLQSQTSRKKNHWFWFSQSHLIWSVGHQSWI